MNLLRGCILLSLILTLAWGIRMAEFRDAEAFRAILGIEMMEEGSYIRPILHGMPYYNKPPLYSWILAGYFKVTGNVEEWVVRIPGLLSLLLSALGIFFLARRSLGEKTAFLASIFFLTGAEMFFYASFYPAGIDLFYQLICFLQIASIYFFYMKKRFLWLFVFSYFFTALGFLTKGIPSIAFQVITLTALFLVAGKGKKLFDLRHLAGIGVFLSLAGTYFFLYSLHGEYDVYLINLFKEASQRSVNESGLPRILPHLFAFPLKVVFLLLPWSLFGLVVIKGEVRKKIRENPLLYFCVIFLLANLLLYWLSPGEKNRYLYPFFPFASILLAYLYQEFSGMQSWKLTMDRAFGGILLFIALLFGLSPVIAGHSAAVEYKPWIAITFTVAFLLIFSFYARWNQGRLMLFLLAWILARTGMGLIMMPTVNETSRSVIMKAHAGQIGKLIGSRLIGYTGDTLQLHSNVPLLGKSIVSKEIIAPPPIMLELPYHLYRKTGQLLLFEEKPVHGKIYLAQEESVEKYEKQIYYRFFDDWTKENVILFELAPTDQ